MKRRTYIFAFLLFFGVLGILRMVGNPRFETLHRSDITQLIASGLCFGFGASVLFGKRKFPGE